MSNRVDYFSVEQLALAVPASRPAVFVGGRLCEFLEVIEVVGAGDPEFGKAVLRYNTAASESSIVAAERIETIVPMGVAVSIRQFYNGRIGQSKPMSIGIFEGRVEGIETAVGPGGEVVEIVAKDMAASLERITVYGERIVTSSGSLFLSGTETVFNAAGLGNASSGSIERQGRSYKAFAAESSGGAYWTVADAVVYLLSEHIVFGRLQIPGVAELESVFGGARAEEIDVDGLSLIKALRKCCDGTGVTFRFVPRDERIGPLHRIVFYRPGRGRAVEMNYQRAGERLSISRTNVCRLDSERAFWPVTHRFIGHGDFKVYEATFDLIEAWDPAGEGGPQSDYSPSTNADFESVRNVYRKWSLNESGDYSQAPYNQGDTFDFSKIFETDSYVQRRRTFEQALSTDASGASLGYYLEVSYDNGSVWQEYTDGFNVSSSECGVWLSSDQLSSQLWSAISAGTLKFRITAAVTSDERLTVEIADGPVDSTAEVVDHVVKAANDFKYRKVSPRSVFYNSTSDEVDDTAGLGGYVRRLSETNVAVIETIDIQTLVVTAGYQAGDRVVTGPDGRDILGQRNDNRSIFWIERVQMDYRKQCTNLRILRRRYYE